MSSSHLDRWAFGMSKIEGDDAAGSASSAKAGGKIQSSSSGTNATAGTRSEDKRKRADSTEIAAERISNVSLDGPPFGEKVRVESIGGNTPGPGPSFLSQQVASFTGSASSSRGGVNEPPPYTSSSPTGSPEGARTRGLGSGMPMSIDAEQTIPLLDGTEKITVKIADLGNGECHFESSISVPFLSMQCNLHLPFKISRKLCNLYSTVLSNVVIFILVVGMACADGTHSHVSHMGRASFHRRYPDTAISLSRSHSWGEVGSQRGHLECSMCGMLLLRGSRSFAV